MTKTEGCGGADFLPLVMGSDALGYTYAREMARTYGARSMMVSPSRVRYSADSRLVDFELADVSREADAMAWLRDRSRELTCDGSRRVLALAAASDWMVRTLSRNAAELETLGYAVPYADPALIATASRKDAFYAMCLREGVPFPRTTIIPSSESYVPPEGAGTPGEAGPLAVSEAMVYPSPSCLPDFPLVLKPSDPASWHHAELPGKRKVYFVRDMAELTAILQAVMLSGYSQAMLAQETVAEGDQSLRTVTAWADGRGGVTVSVAARVLLQDRSGTGIGNPLVIMGDGRDDALRDVARRVLCGLPGYRGYANLDVMVRPDGSPAVLEMNPRPGRNSYYVSLAGCPLVRLPVECFVHGRDESGVLTEEEREAGSPFLFSMVPRSVIARETHGEDRDRALEMWDEGLWRSPLINPGDGLRQRMWAWVNFEHMRAKF